MRERRLLGRLGLLLGLSRELLGRLCFLLGELDLAFLGSLLRGGGVLLGFECGLGSLLQGPKRSPMAWRAGEGGENGEVCNQGMAATQ